MCSDFTFIGLIGTASTASAHPLQQPQLDCLMLFGFLAMFATLTCAVTPHESRNKLLVFAFCLACCAAYGFLQGAWPLGMVESVWCAASLHQWVMKGRVPRLNRRRNHDLASTVVDESRMNRLFGPKY
jgi:hypothetical protein